MPSSIYPSSCLLPQLLLVLRIYWVNINSIIFFTLYVPHQTNYSLITYTTNWKIQAIWRWMKKMHTQASPRSEHQNLIDDRRALFSKSIPVIVSTNIFLHMVFTTKCNLPKSSACLLLHLLLLLLLRDHHPRTLLLYFHDPNCSTYSCCNRMATAPNTTYSKGHCAERRK